MQRFGWELPAEALLRVDHLTPVARSVEFQQRVHTPEPGDDFAW